MTSTRTILMLILHTTFVGCQTASNATVVHHVDPVLSNSLTCEQLVDHLNSQNKSLHGWRCMDTRVYVSMPGVPLPQKLTGSLSCNAPSSFRLMADNFVAQADFGSNDDLCWAYVKPGEPVVMTWRHEDSHLLEYVPGGFPRLDPEWLMVVLGVQPLNAADFRIQKPPAGSRELWLVALEESASGQTLRRVIKVDPVSGVAREHALIDHNGELLLRARLSNHRSCDGSLIPHLVKISFPPQKTELTLEFKNVEANCGFTDALWVPPGKDRIARLDLGDYVRQTNGDLPPRRKPRDEQKIALVPPEGQMLEGTPPRGGDLDETEPENDDSFADPLLDEPAIPGGRFFGENEPEGPDPLFESGNSAGDDRRRSSSLSPIHTIGFQEEPDFDIVAPKTPPRKKFLWNPFR